MAQRRISKAKQLIIGRLVMSKKLNIRECARQLKISRNTVRHYARLIEPFVDTYHGFEICDVCEVALPKSAGTVDVRAIDLQNFLSGLTENDVATFSSTKSIWLKYLDVYPEGYGNSQFYFHFNRWKKKEKKMIYKSWQVQFISKEDLKLLKRWRLSGNRHLWELAVSIIESHNNTPTALIAEKIDRGKDKVRDWINIYKHQGIAGFEKKPRKMNQEIEAKIKEKTAKLIRLIHEPPKLHGINRSSWFLKDLASAYKKSYNIDISTSTISKYLKLEGYVYRKAREVLTSSDPEFRVKMDKIKNILANLRPKEKFFSIDEFGPFAVKIKGGRSLIKKGEIRTYPQIQKSKGFTICTAALELSQNQVTHIFSQKKNTEEIIKLIEVLLLNYADEDKLYLSWDAAAWHGSKKLNNYIDRINEDGRKKRDNPVIELAPLPASAQFLNVIESVFSGLAKSIIHNSNYKDLDECKAAISLYFKNRNEHFLDHLQKAGNKIWGKELVAPVFKDNHNCKDPKFR